MDLLRAQGIAVTHDWTTYEETYGDGATLETVRQKFVQGVSSPQDQSRYGTYANFDLDGVREADLVVMIMDQPEYEYRGTFTELGAALSLGKPVIMTGPSTVRAATNVFYWHSGIEQRVADTEEALRLVLQQKHEWDKNQLCRVCLGVLMVAASTISLWRE